MIELKFHTVPELVAQVAEKPIEHDVHREWKRLPSQSSGVTYIYSFILAGLISAKPDRMIIRSLATGFGEEAELDVTRAVALITKTAQIMNVESQVLYHLA